MSRFAYETDHDVGDKNVELLGLDVHNPVFFICAALIIAFVIGTLATPDTAAAVLGGARAWTLENAHWFFSVSILLVLLFCIALAVSPFGRIRLGGPTADPEFGTPSWLAMLFSAGVGIGLMFWGAAEPLAYYTGWSGTPLDTPAMTPEAASLAVSASIFHWGFHPWAVYALMGLALAFFSFNKGLPLSIRSCFYPLLGERVWGVSGHVIDSLAVVATIFGLATSLGFGALQAASGLEYLFGFDAGIGTQVALIFGITGVAIISVVRGLDRGIRMLSNVNIVLAIILLAFVLITGPTLLIAIGIPTNAVSYLRELIPLSNWINRPDSDWYQDWTIFYWAWWISWSPFVGMFIARVSRGRTIRQFLAAVLLMPVAVSVLWFTVFGTTAVTQAASGAGQLGERFTEVPLVLFQMLGNLPFTEIVSGFAVILLLVFFITSSDSGSLVIDTITAGGKLHPPVPQRIFWATMEGLVAAVLLIGGGNKVLGALQAGAITTALPFTVVLLLCCVSLYQGLRHEFDSLLQRAPNEPGAS